jgi:glycosyltransferase involved in cell wall biosynthesis
VGGLSPHKNLLRLIEAFSRLQDPSAQLVLVGDLGDVFHTHVPELRAAVTRHGVDGRVMFPGFVPDADLAHFYSRALALVQPSLIEGFGLPPVEAMACGAPVLSSTAGSLPEVVGEAGRFFNPLDVNSLCGEMSLILNDPQFRNDLTERVSAQSSRFTWHAAAQGVLKVCEDVAERSGRSRRGAVPSPHLHHGRSGVSQVADRSTFPS